VNNQITRNMFNNVNGVHPALAATTDSLRFPPDMFNHFTNLTELYL